MAQTTELQITYFLKNPKMIKDYFLTKAAQTNIPDNNPESESP